MKRLITVLLVAAITVVGCAQAPDDIEQAPTESVQQAAGTCPTTLFCPSSYGSYNVFMYAIHYTSQINCWYRNGSYQTAVLPLAVDPACSNCCAPGYCPDQRIGQTTWSQSWACKH